MCQYSILNSTKGDTQRLEEGEKWMKWNEKKRRVELQKAKGKYKLFLFKMGWKKNARLQLVVAENNKAQSLSRNCSQKNALACWGTQKRCLKAERLRKRGAALHCPSSRAPTGCNTWHLSLSSGPKEKSEGMTGQHPESKTVPGKSGQPGHLRNSPTHILCSPLGYWVRPKPCSTALRWQCCPGLWKGNLHYSSPTQPQG